MSLAIRPATPTDIDDIARVHVAGWDETYRGLLPDDIIDARTVAHRRGQWQSHFDSPAPGRSLFVATRAENVVGFTMIGPARTVADFAETELFGLYLLRACHGLGLGRGLITAAVEAARGSGAASLGFWVLAGNAAARRFYEAGGARAVAERHDEHGDAALSDIGYRLDL